MNLVEYEWREHRPGKQGGVGKKVTYRLICIKTKGGVVSRAWSTLWLEYMVRTDDYKLHHILPATKSKYERYETLMVGIKGLDDAKKLAEATFNLLGETK